jgi:hypothetical protein
MLLGIDVIYCSASEGWRFEASNQLSRTTDHAPCRPRPSPSQDSKFTLPLAQLKPIPTLRNVSVSKILSLY